MIRATFVDGPCHGDRRCLAEGNGGFASLGRADQFYQLASCEIKPPPRDAYLDIGFDEEHPDWCANPMIEISTYELIYLDRDFAIYRFRQSA